MFLCCARRGVLTPQNSKKFFEMHGSSWNFFHGIESRQNNFSRLKQKNGRCGLNEPLKKKCAPSDSIMVKLGISYHKVSAHSQGLKTWFPDI